MFGDLKVPADILEELRANIARRLTPQPVKVRADLELTNFAFSGILAIQAALAAGEALSTPEIPIKIRLVAPPLYVMVSNTTDKQGAIDLLEKACEVIGEVISKEVGGSLNVRMRPKAVSETDDAELQALMERVARENKEISGMSIPHLVSASLTFVQVTRTLRRTRAWSSVAIKSSVTASISPALARSQIGRRCRTIASTTASSVATSSVRAILGSP